MANADELLTRVLEADRALRDARAAFLSEDDDKAKVAALAKQVDAAFGKRADDDATASLVRMADVLTEIGGPQASGLLFRLLGHEDPSVRLASGEGLEELLYDRYAEVARVIEAEVDKGQNTIALTEVPFVLAEVGEPGGVKIVSKLLNHKSADVVGSAIEALASFGDPSVVKLLEKLKGDKRTVAVDEEAMEGGELTIGELAGEAIEHLRSLQGE